MEGGPVSIDLVAGIALDGALEAPHRPEQALYAGEVGGVCDSQRQHDHGHDSVVGLGPLRGLVLAPELPCPGNPHRLSPPRNQLTYDTICE
jgi:hypothetical protein